MSTQIIEYASSNSLLLLEIVLPMLQVINILSSVDQLCIDWAYFSFLDEAHFANRSANSTI